MKNILKQNTKFILGLIVGIIISGSIGVVVATNIASSSVDYSTTENNSVENVEDALDDLYNQIIGHSLLCYNGTCGKLTYRYWNNNFAGHTGANKFDLTHMPATTYASRELLEAAYGSSNFANNPVYIRSVLIDGNVVGHETCFWEANNEKEYCLVHDYWAGTTGTVNATVQANTKIKLQRDMQNALSIGSTDLSCNLDGDGGTYCEVGSFGCDSYCVGQADCFSRVTHNKCSVNESGHAFCTQW